MGCTEVLAEIPGASRALETGKSSRYKVYQTRGDGFSVVFGRSLRRDCTGFVCVSWTEASMMGSGSVPTLDRCETVEIPPRVGRVLLENSGAYAVGIEVLTFPNSFQVRGVSMEARFSNALGVTILDAAQFDVSGDVLQQSTREIPHTLIETHNGDI